MVKNISIVTTFPQLYESFVATSLIGRAQEKKIVNITVDSLFSFVKPKERIDAPTFGPGAGMLIRPEVVERAINATEKERGKAFKIFFSPHGKKLNQKLLKQLAHQIKDRSHLMLLPARYEGMDARVEQVYADEIISVGDFVLMGGDIPAMMLIEGLLRYIPGIVGKQESVEAESFSGPFVDYPEYTEPVEWHDMKVPDIVRSGNHAAIDQWREQQAAQRTVLDHFDWLKKSKLNAYECELAYQAVPSHYVALMHTKVALAGQEEAGTTSVTSIDIHDIARSSKTYGIKNFFIVTPLQDQQKIVTKLLTFWQEGSGKSYNKQRYKALSTVELVDSFDAVIAGIERKEGKKPIVIATSAQEHPGCEPLSFTDQSKIWQQERPVLFLFGTGQGLADELIARVDYLLPPIIGLTTYNHLSVRSAAAIVLDRWLGISLE